MTQADVIASLPEHLRPFVRPQDYARYTAEDQAVWRFVLHQLVSVLRDTAHPVYQQGLRETGISMEHIPSIDEMNACLAKLGWAAVVVDGFIPPAVFMEFQARRVLPIALDMRSIEHILYTPAPDIVHESAGHAPFIVDVDYAEYLQKFGDIGMRAIATEADHAVYLAIRHLSIVKEAPGSTAADIAEAETRLAEALEANDNSSEAALLSRLHWWTVEYGLVGDVSNYHLFGAGLLSSLGESVSCQDDQKVRKRPLTVDAVRAPYDITNPQPQLFVARSCKHLSQVLDVFADGMAFRRGGALGLERAIKSRSVCTAQYNSGLEVSGQFSRQILDAVGNPVYLSTTGPTQLACHQKELPGHGIEWHAQGFGSPVGKLQNMPHCLSKYSIDELKEQGIAAGQSVELKFLSGIVVSGDLLHITRDDGRNILFSLTNCRVTDADGAILFAPEWGQYDMAIGCRIDSVWGGAADRSRFSLYAPAAEEPTRNPQPRADRSRLLAIYSAIRALREGAQTTPEALQALQNRLTEFPQAWLPRLELFELAEGAQREQFRGELVALAGRSDDTVKQLIGMGLSLADQPNAQVQ